MAETMSEATAALDGSALQRLVGKKITHRAVTPHEFKDGKWTYLTEDREVRLMAIADKWAMVRRPGCHPYACWVRELVW